LAEVGDERGAIGRAALVEATNVELGDLRFGAHDPGVTTIRAGLVGACSRSVCGTRIQLRESNDGSAQATQSPVGTVVHRIPIQISGARLTLIPRRRSLSGPWLLPRNCWLSSIPSTPQIASSATP